MSDFALHIPVRAEILVRFEGSEELHLLGKLEQTFPVKIASGPEAVITFYGTPPAGPD